MKHHLLLPILLLFLAAKSGATGPVFDTIKILTDKELQEEPSVVAMQMAFINLHQVEKERASSNAVQSGQAMLDAYLQIARLYEKERHFSKAAEYYRLAQQQAVTNNQEAEVLKIETALGATLNANGKFDAAYEVLSKALEKYEQAGDYEQSVRILQELAEAQVLQKNYRAANANYLKIKALADRKGDPGTALTALNNLGYLANQLRDFQAATDFFLQAEAFAGEHPTLPKDLLYTNLGVAFHNLGNIPKSIEYLLKAEQSGKADSRVFHLVASIYLLNKDIYNALQYNELALNSAEKSKESKTLCDAYDVSSQIYQQLYEYDKALDFYKKHLTLKDSLLLEERLGQRAMSSLHAAMERMENEIRQQLSEDEIEELAMQQLKAKADQAELVSANQSLEMKRQEKENEVLKQKDVIREANFRATELEKERSTAALKLALQEGLALKQEKEFNELSRLRQLDSLNTAKLDLEQQGQIKDLDMQRLQGEREIERQQEIRKSTARLAWAAGIVALLVTAGLFYTRRLNRRLDAERSRSESLLLNVLPGTVAQELKAKGSATPQRYESVSVLFTDFQGFTGISARMTPEEVLHELNDCFTAFDDIAERHHLEKIKTIGDSYMCAGGLPVKNDTHPNDAVQAAREMLDFLQQRNLKNAALGKVQWTIRIGIHTGAVVAGVVGIKKFAYDIWGDTVNTASRMESNCPPGRINISESTFRLIQSSVDCEYRGEMEAKNLGKMGMYLVGS